jgi:hypothetical protein
VKLADLAAKWKSKGLLFAMAQRRRHAATTIPTKLLRQRRFSRAVHLHDAQEVKIIKFYFLSSARTIIRQNC